MAYISNFICTYVRLYIGINSWAELGKVEGPGQRPLIYVLICVKVRGLETLIL